MPKITTYAVHSFVPGRKYHITRSNRYHADEFTEHGTPLYTFVYIKRNNKLHIFQEVNHGWQCGLSDAQLIGRNVEEIK